MVPSYLGSNDLADAFSTLIASAQRIRTVRGYSRGTQRDARTPMVSSDGHRWGQPWGTGWFRLRFQVPKEFRGETVSLLFHPEGEYLKGLVCRVLC